MEIKKNALSSKKGITHFTIRNNIFFQEKKRRSIMLPNEKHPNKDNTYFLFSLDSFCVFKFPTKERHILQIGKK